MGRLIIIPSNLMSLAEYPVILLLDIIHIAVHCIYNPVRFLGRIKAKVTPYQVINITATKQVDQAVGDDSNSRLATAVYFFPEDIQI